MEVNKLTSVVYEHIRVLVRVQGNCTGEYIHHLN